MLDLYYWPVPFRGHFVRYLLAEVGADWTEKGADEIVAIRALPVSERPYPCFAPTFLHDRETDTWLSQMPAIMMYLGRRFDRIADPDQTLRVVCDAVDVLYEITRFHGDQMWDRPAWEAFLADRLPLWMAMHEVLLRRMGVSAETGFFAGSERVTVADITFSALWGVMADRLRLGEMLRREAPTLAGLVARVEARPGIARVIADWADRTPRYCGGQIEASLMEMTGQGD